MLWFDVGLYLYGGFIYLCSIEEKTLPLNLPIYLTLY